MRQCLILLTILLGLTASAGADQSRQGRSYDSRHFTMQVEGPDDPALAWALLERLESASCDVERRLGAFPGSRVPVTLYTDGIFPAQAFVPTWAQGLFDGHIRLAVVWAELREDSVDRTLRHEYTHALVHARTGGNVPTWLSEGLAVLSENRATDESGEVMRNAWHLIPLSELHGSFLTLSARQVSLAYAESEAAVRYLLARHGDAAVRTLLRRLGEGRAFESAIEDATGSAYAAFQSVWARHVRAPHKTDG